MKIIGIFGKKEAGKSTLAKMIKEEIYALPHGNILVSQIAFGDALKKMLLEAEICTYEELYETKTKFSRFMLQKIGTEIVRKVSPDYWCEKVFEKIKYEHYSEKVLNVEKIIIIDDIRFPNEYKMLSNMNSHLIKVSNFKADSKQDNHESETNIKDFISHIDINNNGTIEELKESAKSLAIFTLQTSIRFPGFNNHNSNNWRTKKWNQKQVGL